MKQKHRDWAVFLFYAKTIISLYFGMWWFENVLAEYRASVTSLEVFHLLLDAEIKLLDSFHQTN